MIRLTAVLILLVVSIVGGVLWWKNGVSAVDPKSKDSVIFVVTKGMGVKEISNGLKEKGLVKSSVVFFLLVKQLGIDKRIEAGDFRLSPSMTAQEIAENLTHGTLDIWITVPEGKRAAEIAQTLKDKIPTYDSSWPNTLESEEGYLFPDTYLIPKDADIGMIVNQMRGNFDVKYATLDTTNTNFTQEEIVILASLIEREAITDAEKPIIAGVLLNRLNAGMALQVDATIQYAKGQNTTNKKWWEPVLIEEYKTVKSDYNTYLFAGLPPLPISNPGLVALSAAANPSDTDYLYYIHDKDRKIRYAKTLAEHNANIEKFGL
ncbi:MAG: endolytic transglycosylase MltG [Candidatus Levybacteria bacterium]|nr:endolytic transglycosylase MltG [Candidatus Levybacteria bacterium]